MTELSKLVLKKKYTFGRAIKCLLSTKGLIQQDLIKVTGVSRSTMSLYLKDKCLPKLATVRKICVYLGLSKEDYELLRKVLYITRRHRTTASIPYNYISANHNRVEDHLRAKQYFGEETEETLQWIYQED